MPCQTPIDELLKEEAVAASPVRRSSRLVSSIPRARLNSVTKTVPPVAPKTRRSSVTKEIEPKPVKAPARGRRASTASVTDEPEPAKRGRRASTSSVTNDELKPRTRRASIAKDAAPEPKTSTSKEETVNDAKPRTRRASIAKEEAPSTTRTTRNSISKEELPPVRTTRRRGSLIHEDTPVKATPVRRTRSTSVDEDKKVEEVDVDKFIMEDIEESNKENDESPEKVDTNASHTEKIVKFNLDLSIISEAEPLNNSKIVSEAKEVSAVEDEVMEILTNKNSEELKKTSVSSEDSFHFSMSEHEDSPQPNSNFGGVTNNTEEDECEPMDVDECTVIESEVNIDSKGNVSLSSAKKLTDEVAEELVAELENSSEEPKEEEIANTTKSPQKNAQEVITVDDGLKVDVANTSLSTEHSFIDEEPTKVETPKKTTIETSLIVETPKKEESQLNTSSDKKTLETSLVVESLNKSVTHKKAIIDDNQSTLNTSIEKKTVEASINENTLNKSLNKSLEISLVVESLNKSVTPKETIIEDIHSLNTSVEKETVEVSLVENTLNKSLNKSLTPKKVLLEESKLNTSIKKTTSDEKLQKISSEDSFYFSLSEHEDSPQSNSNFGGVINNTEEDECEPMAVEVNISNIETDEILIDSKGNVSLSFAETCTSEEPRKKECFTTNSSKMDANASDLMVQDSQEVITLDVTLPEDVANASLSSKVATPKKTTIETSLVEETVDTPKKEESQLNPSTDKKTLETSLVVDSRNKSLNQSDIEKSMDTNEETSSLNKSTESVTPKKVIIDENQSKLNTSFENKNSLVEETLNKSVTPTKALIEEEEESKMNKSTDKETLETSLVVDSSLNQSDIGKSMDTNEETSSLNKSIESNKERVPHEKIIEIPDSNSTDEEKITIEQPVEENIAADAEIVPNGIDQSLDEKEINYIPESPVIQNEEELPNPGNQNIIPEDSVIEEVSPEQVYQNRIPEKSPQKPATSEEDIIEDISTSGSASVNKSPQKSPTKKSPLKTKEESVTDSVEEASNISLNDSVIEDDSVLESSTSQSSKNNQEENITSSIVIQENVKLADASNSTNRISDVVQLFCSGIPESAGNVSVEVSLDYVGTSSESNDTPSEQEPIQEPPVDQEATKTSKRRKKTLEEEPVPPKRQNRKPKLTTNLKENGSVLKLTKGNNTENGCTLEGKEINTGKVLKPTTAPLNTSWTVENIQLAPSKTN